MYASPAWILVTDSTAVSTSSDAAPAASARAGQGTSAVRASWSAGHRPISQRSAVAFAYPTGFERRPSRKSPAGCDPIALTMSVPAAVSAVPNATTPSASDVIRRSHRRVPMSAMTIP